MTSTMRTDVQAFRQACLAHRFQPIAVRTRSKVPAEREWQHARGLPAFAPDAASTGILAEGLRPADVDIDDPAAVDAVVTIIEGVLGPAGPIRQRSGSPRVLLLYRSPEGAPKKRIIKLSVGKVEFLGAGQQFVAAGIHPEGQPYVWPHGSPNTVDRDSLPTVTEAQIDEVERRLKARFPVTVEEPPEPEPAPPRNGAHRGNGHDRGDAWARAALADEGRRVASAPEGSRNDTLNKAALALGQIVAGGGLEEGEVRAKLLSAALNCGLSRNEAKATIDSGLKAGALHPRIPERKDNGGGKRSSTSDHKNSADEATGDATLVPPEDLPPAEDALDIWSNPRVPPFPFETLPAPLATYAKLMARLSGCDPAACAWSAIMSVQAVLDHRIRVRATRHGNYLVGPNLWVAQIGDVSVRKSHPVGQAVERAKPLDRRDMTDFKLRLDGIKDKEERAKVEREEGPRRRVVYDTTSERLCDLLAKQNEGVTLVRDELSGWLGGMSKYGGGGKGGAQDRSIYLAGFDGRSYAQDRMKGSRHIDNLSVGIYGGIQMAALRKQGDLDHDGLLQRFIPLLLRPAAPYEDVEGYGEAELDFERLLTKLDAVRPRELSFSHEAQAIYREIDADSLGLMQAGVVVSEAFRGWIGKTPRRFAAIALILHCIDAVITGKDRDAPISEDTAQKARTIVEFILQHGFRFYDDYAGGSGKGLVVAVADCILRWSTVNVPITLRQIARNTNAMKNSDLTQRDRLEILDYFVAAGWLLPVERHFMNRSWWVVPGLAERFAHERRARSQWIAAIQARFPQREM